MFYFFYKNIFFIKKVCNTSRVKFSKPVNIKNEETGVEKNPFLGCLASKVKALLTLTLPPLSKALTGGECNALLPSFIY